MLKLGVILLNLGGPNSLEDIQPFLENLFLDPEIIDIPLGPMIRRPLARFISTRRAEKVKLKYAAIGGRSPIVERTREQAAALEARLNERYAGRARCLVESGMRYWHPFTAEAMERFAREEVSHVFLLPLYPQFSRSTTGSSFKEWKQLHREKRFRVASAYAYAEHPAYIEALNARIEEGLKRFGEAAEPIHFLFSAHGIPVKMVENGDPYPRHVERTVAAVMRLRGNDHPHALSFQSKVGPAKWLEPATDETVRRLGKEGVKRLLVIPVAFVSDHIETLHELDIEVREIAEQAGIREYYLMPALNDSPRFIDALVDLVAGKMDKRIPA